MKKSKGELILTSPGLYCSIQDKGRPGYAHLGLPAAGAMDQISYAFVNHLLRNSPGAACLEIYLSHTFLEFSQPTQVCLSGANAETILNNKKISCNKIYKVEAGNQLTINTLNKGQIIYLGVKNGFRNKKIMDSRSNYVGITKKAYCQKGDTLFYDATVEMIPVTHSKPSFTMDALNNERIEVFPGPEWDLLDTSAKKTLLENKFTISGMQNRMGVQLNEEIKAETREIMTVPVFPGTVQLTPSGKLIILMRDAQVTGGYPRILQLTGQAISLMAQKPPGSQIRFRLKDGQINFKVTTDG